MQPSSAVNHDAAMNPEMAGVERQWFALGVMPRHEKTVSRLLGHKGHEVFLPLFSRRHQYAHRVREFDLPLFPGYVFCRIDPTVRFPILTTPGVVQFIGAGRIPISIEDAEITALQRAVRAGVPLEPCAFSYAGRKGRIVDGPLRGIEGLIVTAKSPANAKNHENAKNSVRLVISVNLLKRSVFLEIDSDCVIAG